MDDELVNAAEYATRSGIDKQTYERRLVEAMQYALCEAPSERFEPFDESEPKPLVHLTGNWYVEQSSETRGRLVPVSGIAHGWTVQRIEVDGTDRLAVTFTASVRPECRFIWRSAIWPVPAPGHEDGTPEAIGEALAQLLSEDVDQGGMIALTPADEHGVVNLDHYA